MSTSLRDADSDEWPEGFPIYLGDSPPNTTFHTRLLEIPGNAGKAMALVRGAWLVHHKWTNDRMPFLVLPAVKAVDRLWKKGITPEFICALEGEDETYLYLIQLLLQEQGLLDPSTL